MTWLLLRNVGLLKKDRAELLLLERTQQTLLSQVFPFQFLDDLVPHRIQLLKLLQLLMTIV